MRTFTSYALAGLICAGIYALQLRTCGTTAPWRSAVIGFAKSWEFSWLAEGQYNNWPWSQKTHASSGAVALWDILYHVGGNGPWIRKLDGTAGEDIGPPAGCKVEQIHMVSDCEYGSVGPQRKGLQGIC